MRGFSLVELAIVLVILGLLTGGILAGQSLIRAAELRSVVADYQRFVSATQTFRDKYMALPGDMNNATRFWLRQVNATHCVTNSSAAVGTPGTCDGNGDGIIDGAAAASQSGEMFQFWRQLANAGLIEGSYSGLSQGTNGASVVVAVNVPAGKISNSGWHTQFYSITGHGFWFDNNYGNYLTFGLQQNNNHPAYALTPEETWNIDMKMDDGRPGQGRLWTNNRSACTDATAGTAAAAAAAQYNFTSNVKNCSPVWSNAF